MLPTDYASQSALRGSENNITIRLFPPFSDTHSLTHTYYLSSLPLPHRIYILYHFDIVSVTRYHCTGITSPSLSCTKTNPRLPTSLLPFTL